MNSAPQKAAEKAGDQVEARQYCGNGVVIAGDGMVYAGDLHPPCRLTAALSCYRASQLRMIYGWTR